MVSLDGESALPKSSRSGLGLGGDKNVVGGGGAPSQSAEALLQNPQAYRKVLQETNGFSAEAFSWNNLMLDAVGANAVSWFEGLHPIPTVEAIETRGFSAPSSDEQLILSRFFGSDAMPMLPDLIASEADLGEQVPIPQSSLGQKLIQVLSDLGVGWNYTNTVTLGADDDNMGAVLQAELEMQLEGFGQWGNGFETPYVQKFCVYRKVDGSEHIFWSIDALAASRAYAHLNERELFKHEEDGTRSVWTTTDEPGVLRNGRITEELALPTVAMRAFFLAETPFPSNAWLMSMSRSAAYPDIPESLYPLPTLVYERDALAAGVMQSQGQNTLSYMHSLFPTVVKMGWRITDMSVDQLKVVIPVVSDGVYKISTILEDGYRNYNIDDYPAPFDLALDAAVALNVDYVPGDTAGGFSQWIPVSMIGMKLEETMHLVYAAIDATQRGDADFAGKAYERIATDGAGIIVTDSTNTLVFSHLFPDGEYERAEFLLDMAQRLPAGYQAINAKSNRGIALFMLGRLDEAEQVFREILDLGETLSESEASYYLALICRESGRIAEAEEFETQCENAGGYTPFDAGDASFSVAAGQSVSSETSATHVSSADSKPQARFCSECGTERTSPDARFCTNCGKSL